MKFRAPDLIYVPSPAAGQFGSHEVPGATAQKVVALGFTFAAGAAAANRQPTVEFSAPDGSVIVAVSLPFNVIANGSTFASFGVGLMQFGANTSAFMGGPLPDVWLSNGMTVSVGAVGIQAADTLTAVRLLVAQYRFPPEE